MILIVYFYFTGGYKQVHLEEAGAADGRVLSFGQAAGLQPGV